MLVRVAAAPPQIPGLSDWRALARGGFATVWQAKQESLNRFVAVKVDQRRLDEEVEQRRFLREAGAAGRLSGHPGIVTVHDAGILDDDRPFLVMELCPGGSLTKWLTADPKPSQQRIREVGIRVADALSAAHGRGVLHRDVKPANILIDAYNNPGLADFGLAAMPDPDEELSETIDAVTPAYAPPEVIHRQPATEFGDVYSLAATLYALLSGRPPRVTDSKPPSIAEIMERQQEPIARIPGVDEHFMDLILEALADTPTARPTAARFRDQLTALELADIPDSLIPSSTKLNATAENLVAQTSPTVDSPTQQHRNRRRSRFVLAGVLAVLVFALIITIVNLRDRPIAGGAPPIGSSLSASPIVSPSDSPSKTPSKAPSETPAPPVPANFTDCSATLGGLTYCAVDAECWSGIFAYADTPSVATRRGCRVRHVYQSFAAGRLGYEARRQPKLESDPQVRKVCTVDLVNSMLSADDRRSDWEILVLGPQGSDEDFYRCIFGHGNHSRPYKLKAPK